MSPPTIPTSPQEQFNAHAVASLILRDPKAVAPTVENQRLIAVEIHRCEVRASVLRCAVANLRKRKK